MSEVKTTLVTNVVENLPMLEEVPEGATLIAEVDGEFYRVKGEGVGGGSGGAEPDVIIAVDGDINSIIDYGLADSNPRFIKGSYADLYSEIFVNKTVPTVVLWTAYGHEEWTNEILPCQFIQTHIEEERIDLHFDWRWVTDGYVTVSCFILYLNSDGSMSGYAGGFTKNTGYTGNV